MCRELGVISSAVAGCDGRLLSPKTAWSCTTRPLIESEMCASVDGCSPKSGRSMQGIRLSKNISALSWLEHLLEWMVPNQASCLHACFVGFRMVPVVALASCSAGTDVAPEAGAGSDLRPRAHYHAAFVHANSHIFGSSVPTAFAMSPGHLLAAAARGV